MTQRSLSTTDDSNPQEHTAKPVDVQPELLAVFRLLVREPPPDHDFKSCPLCRKYGIERI